MVLAPSKMPIDLVFPATVVSLHSDGAAENVLPGDRLLAINGQEVALGVDGLASPHLVERMRIEPGSRIALQLLRPGVGVELGSVVAAPNPPTHLEHESWDGALPGAGPEAEDPRSATTAKYRLRLPPKAWPSQTTRPPTQHPISLRQPDYRQTLSGGASTNRHS